MDPEEAADRLSGTLEGDARADDVTRELYSTAACIYRERPLVVVKPASREDVAEAVRFASRNDVPVTARGAGSSLAGQALGPGLVMDFSVHMDSVLEVNPEEGWVDVEPGVVLSRLNEELERYGLFFPPDPSSGGFCTLGGMLANNSSGAHSLLYGDTRKYTLGIECVLPDGSVVGTGVLGDGLEDEVASLVEGRGDLVEEWTPDVSKNSSGYHLRGFLEERDATPALVGSEGTLAVFTRARLRLERLPPDRSTALLHFPSLESAGEAVPRLLEHDPSAVEIMDSTFIDLVREKDPEVGEAIPAEAETSLLVDFDGEPDEVGRSMEAAVGSVSGLCVDWRSASDEEERETLWEIRRAGLPLLFRKQGDRKVTPFIEDVVVPPRKLPRYVEQLRSILDEHGVEAVVYGHAGEGNVHARPLLDLDDPEDRELMEDVADDVFELVADLGGTISGEHGDGYLRTGRLGDVYGPLTELFEELKEAVDPRGVLNPGKVVGPDRMTENLRPMSVGDGSPLAEAAERCHGCGMCRSHVSGRMCPQHSLHGREEVTPRAKANLARAVEEGRLTAGDARETLTQCHHCRACLTECYTGVDGGAVAGLTETSSLRGMAESLFGLVGRVGRLLPTRRPNPPWIAKKLLGVTDRREMPQFEGPELGSVLPREPEGERSVALFAGCHVRYYDSGPGRALAEVLERSGYTVYLPDQVCCGLPMFASGRRGLAERAARRNLERLPDDVPVVSTCPGCVLFLRRDYPKLLGAEHDLDVYEAFELLELLRERGDFAEPDRSLDEAVALHEPCNSRALGGSSAPDFLSEMTELAEVEDDCCGMGGGFGYRAESYRDSVDMGRRLFDEMAESGATPVTECPSCELQLEHVLGEARHPLEVLRDAYSNDS